MNLKVEQNHSLSIEEARQRIGNFAELLGKHGLTVTWTGENEATVKGKYIIVEIDAVVKVSEKAVVIEGKDPGFLWRNKAKEFLSTQMAAYLK